METTLVALNIAVDCAVPFWLTIDDQDGIPVVEGQATILVPRGKHALVWALQGAEGDSFSAVVREGGREVCVVDGWTAPADHRGWVGAYVKFEA